MPTLTQAELDAAYDQIIREQRPRGSFTVGLNNTVTSTTTQTVRGVPPPYPEVAIRASCSPPRSARSYSGVSASGNERGMSRIQKERFRQTDRCGHDTEKDARYVNGELPRAAKAYEFARYDLWPWGAESFKPGSRIRNLERAGALWLAERDRVWSATDAPSEGAQDAAYEASRIGRMLEDLLVQDDTEREPEGCPADTRRTAPDYGGQQANVNSSEPF